MNEVSVLRIAALMDSRKESRVASRASLMLPLGTSCDYEIQELDNFCFVMKLEYDFLQYLN